MNEKFLKGKAHKLGDNINTDYIISGRYKFKTLNNIELAKHLLEDIYPNFYQKITAGDFIVAGENFGCGSSREQAPLAIKYAGLRAVIAKSFARIFYRNAINIGLPIITADTHEIDENDTILIDLAQGKISIPERSLCLPIEPFPPEILGLIEAGGLVEYFKKYGGWHFSF